jgi:tetratricopeptide (TPR) repeat protein
MRRTAALALVLFLTACARVPWFGPATGDAALEAGASASGAAAPEPAPREVEGAEVASILPARSDLVLRGERVYWQADASHEYELLRARERDWLLLATPIGELRASWGLLAQWNPAPLRDLPALLAHAGKASVRGEDVVLYEEELSGSYLVGRDFYVLREGVLREVPREPLAQATRTAHEASRARLERAVQALVAALPGSPIALESRRAVADTLAQIALQDAQGNLDFVPPSFARRLVRTGWLDVLGAPPAQTRELRDAVLQAERTLPLARFDGLGSRMELVEDAFGNRVWALSTPQRVGYARLAPPPAYYTNTSVTRLVVRLPRGSDPLRDASRFTAVELWDGPERIAAWDPEHGFSSDAASWRAAFPTAGAGVEWAALPDALPPHILVTAPNGDVLALLTAFGRLDPARGGGETDAESFYRAAAGALPDAAHLDLIGQYLLVYTYDSPDPRRPLLLGTSTVSGDLHQTASQTLDAQAGGMLRGDCDDLSELYQEIAERQGRVAHMIGLPAHAALAWSQQGEDQSWLTYVLQTGQPLAFPGATLADSLELTYKSFGSGELFDLTKLEVLLRFSGENTRSSWFLSSRIFADPDYARTMIDVQRDWHFQTYQRAIEKMRALITGGDGDASNYTELAGLYHYTGQYELASDALAEASARTPPGETRVSMSVDRVIALLEAGRVEEGRALARDLVEIQIPTLEETMGTTLLDPRLALVDALQVERGDLAFALEILASQVTPEIEDELERLAESLEAEKLDLEVWRLQTESVRAQIRWYVASGVSLLLATRDGDLAEGDERETIEEGVEQWIDQLAFRELDPSDSPLSRYAVVARFYEARFGPSEIVAKIEVAPLPATGAIDHAERDSDDAQMERDLSFARISPTFWASELASLFAKERTTLDVERVEALARRSEQARAEARALGLEHRGFEREAREVRLIRALATGDEPALRAELREVKLESDRRMRMNAASWVATASRFQTLGQFQRVVAIWREEVDYKPIWFWIAWTAALSGATDQALLVAKSAAGEYPDDRAFVEEYEFMQARFSVPPSAGRPKPASDTRSSRPESPR